MNRFFLIGSALIGLASALPAVAAPTTFFGEDVNTGGDPTQVTPTSSTAARNLFFTNLVGVGTETFESIANGSGTPLAIDFGAAGTATINGSGNVAAGNDGNGRYAVSGNQYYLAGTGDFTIDFSAPIAALGFYGIDVGDFGGHLTLTLTDAASNLTTVTVPNTVGSGGSTSGSVLYFGFYDTGDTYISVSFNNDSGGADLFAFDDFSIGSTTEVVPVPAPEPLSIAVLGAGLLGLSFCRRRRG